MSKSKPVLFRVTNNLDIGGVQKRLTSVLPLLTNKFEVHVVTYRKKGSLAPQLEQQNIPVHHFPIKGKTHLPSIIKLASFFKKYKASIIHTHSLGANIPGMLAAALAGVPVRIAQVHRKNLHWYARSRLQRKKQILLEAAVHRWTTDKVLFVSQESLEYYQQNTKLPKNKLQVLHNGFEFPNAFPSPKEARQMLHLPEDKKIIGFVGRLSQGKGLDYFLEFAKKALSEDNSLFFLVIGEGPSRPEKEKQVKDEGLEANFHFAGEQNAMTSWYRALDLLLFTSEPWAEGMPGVVLEACIFDLPILARPSKTIQEIRTYYSRINFIDEQKQPLQNIQESINSPQDNKNLFRQEFSLQTMADRTRILYQSILSKKQPPEKL